MSRGKGRKPSKASIKAAAERAAARSKGEPVKAAKTVLDPPDVGAGEAAAGAPTTPVMPPYIFGRPSVYQPDMCQRAVDLGMLGKSRTQIACWLGISLPTLRSFEKKHADFLSAMSIAIQFSQNWWEDEGQASLRMGKEFNGHMFSFQMKNRFKDDYQDKVDVKHDSSAAFVALLQKMSGAKTQGATT